MTIKIQFLLNDNSVKECFPEKIRLTQSLNKETGTIILTFSKIFSVDLLLNQSKPILGLYILDEKYSFYTKDIRCIWNRGKPLLIQAIFLIDKKENLYHLLKIFKRYAKNNGLNDYNLE